MIFQTFSCHDVGSQEQEELYMTADYRVSCDSERYSFAFWWAFAMVFLYPIGGRGAGGAGGGALYPLFSLWECMFYWLFCFADINFMTGLCCRDPPSLLLLACVHTERIRVWSPSS